MENFSLAQVLLIKGNNQICQFFVPPLSTNKENQMNLHALKTALALLALGATSAMAEPLTLQSTGLPSYLSQGKYQGSFDAAFLPKNAVINSLQFSFLFVDDGDTVPYRTGDSILSKPVSLRQMSSDKTRQAGRTFTETVTTTVTLPRTGVGEQESVKLSFGASAFSGATQEVKSDVTTPGSTRTDPAKVLYVKNNENVSCLKTQWENGTANCQQVTRTVVTRYETRTLTTDYTGEIVLGGSLIDDKDLLAAFLRDRRLDFSLDVLGDLDLFGATLDIDFTPLDIAAVPEPASISLFGIAMLGLAGARRKRRA